MKLKPFTPYRFEEEREKDTSWTFTIRINKEEREMIDKAKALLNQPKDSTVLKQLARVGAIVLQQQQTNEIINTIFKNKANNKRTGREIIQ